MLDINFGHARIPWAIKAFLLGFILINAIFCILGIYYLISGNYTAFIIVLSFGFAVLSLIVAYFERFLPKSSLVPLIWIFFTPIDMVGILIKLFLPEFPHFLPLLAMRFFTIFGFINFAIQLLRLFQ